MRKGSGCRLGKEGMGVVKGGEEKEVVFWMRDPKSGNWIPENHLNDDLDAAQHRDKFLSKKL